MDELQEQQEFGEEEVGDDGIVRGLMGDSIPISSLDPSKDPNITVPEVFACVQIDWNRMIGILIMRRIWTSGLQIAFY